MRQHLHLPEKLNGAVWRYGNAASANRRHTHAELELNLVHGGVGTYLLGNRRYQIRRGDLLWLLPGQEHVLIEQTSDFGMWIAVFRRTAVRRAVSDSSSRELLQSKWAHEPCRRLIREDLRRLEDLFVDLTASTNSPALLNAGLAYALLQAWRSFERAADAPVCDVHPAVERAARIIRDRSAALTLEELAHRAGLSAPRLSRLFKEQTGFALAEFRNRSRVERFLEIYGVGQRHTMLSAALDAGFGSYAQFHRVFRRVMDESPIEYRRRQSAQRS